MNNRYDKYCARWGMTTEAIRLEKEADRLISQSPQDKEYPAKTANAESIQAQRHSHMPLLDSDAVAAIEWPDNPETEADAAIQALGTSTEQAVWAAYKESRSNREASGRLGVDESVFSRTLARCERKIQTYHSRYAGWESVYRAEISRHGKFSTSADDPLPEQIRKAREYLETETGCSTSILERGNFDVHIWVHSYEQLPEEGVKITAHQLITLADLGSVRLSSKDILTLENISKKFGVG